jgi:S-adenosylmethionine:tRNA ribosyltransferase-isomerase
MRTDELDFDLPPELIAQEPTADRSAARLLYYRRGDRSIAHRRFSDLPALLKAGDLLVLNDSRVIPARFLLQKASGGLIDGLFLSESQPGRWTVMLRNLGNSADPLAFVNDPRLTARARPGAAGLYELEIKPPERAESVLNRIGRMPLPPYIHRERGRDPRDELDRERYQTRYAHEAGSVAAPTAGLHFTDELLKELTARGVEQCFVTLHVGMGTFKPLTVDRLEDHVMHCEPYTLTSSAADSLRAAKRDGRRIIAVGTTAARVLESQPAEGPIAAGAGQTRLFIYPPYPWKHIHGLITNFHLPRSTLLALVAALVGLEEQRRLYRIAIENRYRFFSYGDAMLIE